MTSSKVWWRGAIWRTWRPSLSVCTGTRSPLVHTAVYMEMAARSLEALRELQTEVQTELARCKIQVDRLLLRQKEGFLSTGPVGSNVLGIQYERVLPASSAANLFPRTIQGRRILTVFQLDVRNVEATFFWICSSGRAIRPTAMSSFLATAARVNRICSRGC